jgi:hypothetical protein
MSRLAGPVGIGICGAVWPCTTERGKYVRGGTAVGVAASLTAAAMIGWGAILKSGGGTKRGKVSTIYRLCTALVPIASLTARRWSRLWLMCTGKLHAASML